MIFLCFVKGLFSFSCTAAPGFSNCESVSVFTNLSNQSDSPKMLRGLGNETEAAPAEVGDTVVSGQLIL